MKIQRIPNIIKLWLAVGLVLTILPWAGFAGADDAPIWLMGGGASPKGPDQTIRMESEDVTIRLHKNTYTVDAVFHFFNTGETRTEWVGFPKRGKGYADMFDGTKDFIRFETWVDDQKVSFSEERERLWSLGQILSGIFTNRVKTDNRWLVKHVTFPARSVTTTRVSYEANYLKSDGLCAFYIYGTGSYWKDSIGKASFIVDGNNLVSGENLHVTCDSRLAITRELISRNAVRYQITDFKPDLDAYMRICFYSIFTDDRIDAEKHNALGR